MGTKRTIKRTASTEAITLKEAFADFYAEKEAANLAPSTLRNYRQSYEYFLEFHAFTEDNAVNEIEQSHFFKWINTMLVNGVKPVSVNHYLRDLRTFAYWCMDSSREYLPAFKISLVKEQEVAPKTYEDDDIRALLVKPDSKSGSFADWRTWAMVGWMLGTGNRGATVCEVKIGDVNFRTKEITLRHTKARKAQILPLSASLATMLKEYIRMWRAGAGADAWLFPNVAEDKLTTNAFRHSYARYCKIRNIAQTNPHGLRHTFAKNWLINGGNLFKLQQILGHANLEMTRRYVKLCSADLAEDYESHSVLDVIKQPSNRTQKVHRAD